MPLELPKVANPFTVPSSVHTNSHSPESPPQQSETDAWDFEYDHEEINKTIQENLPEDGVYYTKELEAKREIRDGRLTTRYYGKAYRDGKTAQVSIFTSATKGFNKKDPSKLDFSYLQFVKCRDAYAAHFGRPPKNPDELDNFMRKVPLELSLKRGIDQMNVNSIKGVKA